MAAKPNFSEGDLERAFAELRQLLMKAIQDSGALNRIRELLGDQDLRLQIILLPIMTGAELPFPFGQGDSSPDDEGLRFDLTADDREFLKRHGLRFDVE